MQPECKAVVETSAMISSLIPKLVHAFVVESPFFGRLYDRSRDRALG